MLSLLLLLPALCVGELLPVDDAAMAQLREIAETGIEPVITLVDPNFVQLALVMAFSYQLLSVAPIIALTVNVSDTDKERLRKLKVTPIEVPPLDMPGSTRSGTFTKLRVWQLTMFPKVLKKPKGGRGKGRGERELAS